MHEITVHQLFPCVFRAFFLKMGWKWEILSHLHFWPKLLSFRYPSTTGVSKEAQMNEKFESLWLMLPDWFNQTWKFANVIVFFIIVFQMWFRLKFLILFCFFWDAWQSLSLGNGGRNSVLDLGNMKGIRNQKSHCASEI